MFRVALLSVGFVSLAAVVGCSNSGSEKVATVTGKVVLANGKPVPGGRINFVGPDGKVSVGQIKPDGTYEAANVPQGECKVAIDNAYLKGWSPPKGSEAMPNAAETAKLKYVPIDARYGKPETSGLSTTVEGRADTFDVTVR